VKVASKIFPPMGPFRSILSTNFNELPTFVFHSSEETSVRPKNWGPLACKGKVQRKRALTCKPTSAAAIFHAPLFSTSAPQRTRTGVSLDLSRFALLLLLASPQISAVFPRHFEARSL
jgi:hypothetical protein